MPNVPNAKWVQAIVPAAIVDNASANSTSGIVAAARHDGDAVHTPGLCSFLAQNTRFLCAFVEFGHVFDSQSTRL